MSLYKRSTGWLGCGWTLLPTFGYLYIFAIFNLTIYLYFSNEDYVCQNNPTCPIQPGQQVIEVMIDPSAMFSGIFRYFHNDQVII